MSHHAHTALPNSPFRESVSSDADKLLRTRDPSAACVLKNVWACVFDALQNTPKQSCQCDKSAQKLYFSLLPPLDTNPFSDLFIQRRPGTPRAARIIAVAASVPRHPFAHRLSPASQLSERQVRGLRIRREAARGRSVLAGLEAVSATATLPFGPLCDDAPSPGSAWPQTHVPLVLATIV